MEGRWEGEEGGWEEREKRESGREGRRGGGRERVEACVVSLDYLVVILVPAILHPVCLCVRVSLCARACERLRTGMRAPVLSSRCYLPAARREAPAI